MVAQVIQYDSAPTSSEHDEPNCRNNRVGRKLSEKSPLRNRGSRVMTSALSCDYRAPFPAGTTQTLYTRPSSAYARRSCFAITTSQNILSCRGNMNADHERRRRKSTASENSW